MAFKGKSGSNVSCRMVIEDTTGAIPATPIILDIGFVTVKIDPGQPFEMSMTNDGKRTPKGPVLGARKNTWSMECEVTSWTGPLWDQLSLGKRVVDASATPLIKHTCDIEEDSCVFPSATYEFDFTPCDGTLALYRISNAVINTITWQAQGGTGHFKIKMDGFYTHLTNPVAALTGIAGMTLKDLSTASATNVYLEHKMVANSRILIDGVASAQPNFSNFTFTHTNGITPTYGYGDEGEITALTPGEASTKLSGNWMIFTNADLDFLNDSDTIHTFSSQYNVNAGGTKYRKLEIDAFRCPIYAPGVEGRKIVEVPVEFTCFRSASTGRETRVTSMNDQVATDYTTL